MSTQNIYDRKVVTRTTARSAKVVKNLSEGAGGGGGTDTLTTGNLVVTTATTTGTLASTTSNNSGVSTTETLIATATIRNAGVEMISSSTRPTTRVGGTALVIGDRWYNPTLQREGFWDGTDWVSRLLIGELPRLATTSSSSHLTIQTSIPFASGTILKVKDWVVGYANPNATPALNYQEVYLTRRTAIGTLAGSTDIGGAVLTNAVSGISTVAANTTLTIGTDIIAFGIRTAIVGATGTAITIQASFSYVVVF